MVVAAFHVVSMESGELLYSVVADESGRDGQDAEIEELQQSLKLYAIYCQLKQCSMDESTAQGDCWMKNGAFGIMFKEVTYSRSGGGKVPAVMILVKSAGIAAVKACFEDLVSLVSDQSSRRKDRCLEVMKRSL